MKANIERLGPVLVNKGVVCTLANFLVQHNPWYHGTVTVDEGNSDNLYEGAMERALPGAIDIAYLNTQSLLNEQQDYRPAYVDEFRDEGVIDSLAIDAVGYTAGDHSPCNFRQMKAAALAHCLDGHRFVRVQSGTAVVNEQDPAFMTWAFPQLDPFGIGGFNHPDRREHKKLSFAHQLHNLLLQDDSRFASDPNFAYVCWNVLQRKDLNTSLSFRVPAQERVDLGQTLYEIAPALTDMMRIWQSDPWVKSRTELQKLAIYILNRLQGVSHHVKGTTGYKQLQ